MNNIKIKTTNKKPLITVVLYFITANTCCCTMHQNMARGLKFRFRKKRNYTVRKKRNYTVFVVKTKALVSFADRLRLCSSICKKQVFSRGSIIDILLHSML